MKPHSVKTILIGLLAVALLIQACSDSESKKAERVQKNDPRLTGTWQQTAIGKEQVSGIVVKLIFAENTLTMDAPGCLIIGNYTSAHDVFTYSITSVQGDRCANTQKVGESDSVHYGITGSKLFLTPLSAGEESRTEYKRIENNQRP